MGVRLRSIELIVAEVKQASEMGPDEAKIAETRAHCLALAEATAKTRAINLKLPREDRCPRARLGNSYHEISL